MNHRKAPHYELQRVYADGSESTPEIVPVTALPWDTTTNRRGFLGASLTTATALALLGQGGCAAKPPYSRAPTSRAAKGPLRAHMLSVEALIVTPDGKLLVSGSLDNTVKLWSLPEGRILRTLKGERFDAVNALAVTPDGKVLASGWRDKVIKLWSLPDGQLLQTLEGHKGSVSALTVTPDGTALVSGSLDNTVKLWSLPEGRFLRTLEVLGSGVLALGITPDGKVLAWGLQQSEVMLGSLPEGRRYKILVGRVLTVTPDGKLLASSGSNDLTLKLWSLPEGRLFRTLKGHKNLALALAVTPDGKALASGSRDKMIKLWSLPEGQLIRTLEDHKESVNALAVTPDGMILASGSGDGQIILWDLEKGTLRSFLFDPEANETGNEGQVYEVWDAVTGRVVTYTLPCGTPIPPGAVCTCNCVPGTMPKPEPRPAPSRPGTGHTICTCDLVCTCIPVCQAHRLLHEDSTVRRMAQELLLIMGEQEFDYMAWAAETSEPALRDRIRGIMDAIRAGAKPDPSRWPDPHDLATRLDDPDEVVAIMAAQILRLKEIDEGRPLQGALQTRVDDLLRQAVRRPWFVRVDWARGKGNI